MLEKKKLEFKLVNIEDAEFILDIRKNPKLNRYISETSITVKEQVKWIENYKQREKQNKEYYYLIIYNKIKYGTLRIYNIENNKATWGSWILKPERPDGLAVFSACESFKICFEKLGLKKIFLKVNRQNSKAIHLYEKMGFEKINEDEKEIFYFLDKKKFLTFLKD